MGATCWTFKAALSLIDLTLEIAILFPTQRHLKLSCLLKLKKFQRDFKIWKASKSFFKKTWSENDKLFEKFHARLRLRGSRVSWKRASSSLMRTIYSKYLRSATATAATTQATTTATTTATKTMTTTAILLTAETTLAMVVRAAEVQSCQKHGNEILLAVEWRLKWWMKPSAYDPSRWLEASLCPSRSLQNQLKLAFHFIKVSKMI